MPPQSQARIDRQRLAGTASLRIIISDLGESAYWTWSWGSLPEVAVTPPEQVCRVRQLLAAALPGQVPADAEVRPAELPPGLVSLSGLSAGESLPREPRGSGVAAVAGRRGRAKARRLAQAAMVNRCMTGPLSTPKKAARWAEELADALLPAALRAEVRSHVEEGGRIELTIMPSGACAAVPWEILPVSENRVLLDVADITHFAPMTQREVAGVPPDHWDGDGLRRPLWVIDPGPDPQGRRHILDGDAHAVWRTRGEVGTARVAGDYDRVKFSRDLLRDPAQPSRVSRASRLFYLGHVTGSEADPEATALMLGCDAQVYGANMRNQVMRGLTARDALVGTVDLYEEQAIRRGTRLRFPEAALGPDGEPREVPGSELWPMPARVALIACDSGPDFNHPEPFGLITAFFEAGAELITATRWALITDRVFACYGVGHESQPRRPLHEAALRVDAAHDGQRPVAEIAAWQLERLDAWRAGGDIADSPLTWAALANYVRHPRASPLPPGLAGLIDEGFVRGDPASGTGAHA